MLCYLHILNFCDDCSCRMISCGAISGFLCLEDVWVKINNLKKKKIGWVCFPSSERRTKQTWVTLNLQRICRTQKKRFAWLTWQILLKRTNMWVTGWDQETGCGHRRHLRWCQHNVCVCERDFSSMKAHGNNYHLWQGIQLPCWERGTGKYTEGGEDMWVNRGGLTLSFRYWLVEEVTHKHSVSMFLI